MTLQHSVVAYTDKTHATFWV